MYAHIQNARWNLPYVFYFLRQKHINSPIIEKSQAIVGDGLSIGRPCCGVFRCLNALQNGQHRFCAEHIALHNVCAIVDCNNPVHEVTVNNTVGSGPSKITKKKTCSLDAHQQIEAKHHERNKHAVTHAYCQLNCNPAMYPELMDDTGGWFFNTSVAEQTNAWLGGYHSMCREMLPAKFDFFLDEMIRLRNIEVIRHLDKQGHCPRTL